MRANLAGLLVGLGLATGAVADNHRYATDEVWRSECGACHVAFPPALLSAEGWRGILGGLDKHFGVTASLEPAIVKHLATFAQRHAGPGESVHGHPVSRITDTRWFRNEHREVGGEVWKRPEVGARTRCDACHTTADQGDYSGRHVRVPGGRAR